MRLCSPLHTTALIFCFFFLSLFVAQTAAQNCPPPQQFEASGYNTYYASYDWTPDQSTHHYVIEVFINGQLYAQATLPGSASSFALDFSPPLKHHDEVVARLTKHCSNGESGTSSNYFIIVTDTVVYIIGNPQPGQPNTVEPVFIPNDNLIPKTSVCGLCDPGFFRLEGGFYSAYDISLDHPSYTIEQVRFLKQDLCACLDAAVDAGVLNPLGGPGPRHEEGKPFNCKMNLYIYEKKDCERAGKSEGERTSSTVPAEKTRAIPNPFTDVLQFSWRSVQAGELLVSVLDMAGKTLENRILNTTEGDQQFLLDTQSWPSGMFMLRLQEGDQLESLKVVKQR